MSEPVPAPVLAPPPQPPVPEHLEVPGWLRPLLPADLRDEPNRRRSAGDWILDVVAFIFAAGLGALVLSETWSDHSSALAAVDVALAVVACVAMWWRRRHPVAFGLFSGAVSIVSSAAGGAAIVGLFNATVRASARGFAAVVAMSGVVVLVVPIVYPAGETYLTNLVIGMLFTGTTIGWGLFMRVRRELVRSLRERAARAEEERRLHAEQARDAERKRIAREMHDVLAHRVSLLSLHAGALEFRPDAPPAEVAEAAGVIRAAAHDALQELREVIGVLRDGSPAGDGRDGRPEPPQPTLAQVPALVEESRAAGMRVRLTADASEPAEIGDVLGRTAYRIVQEGLTNARKHAPGAAVEVAIALAAGEGAGRVLRVAVVSRPSVGAAATDRPDGEPLPGAGTGLIGLTERVTLAGGELAHGRDAAGDFVLRAVLPVEGAHAQRAGGR